MEKINNPGIVVKRIKRLSFSINESLIKVDTSFQSEIGLKFGFSLEANLLDFTVEVQYHYPNSTETLANLVVQNLFEIPDINEYLIDGIIKLPPMIVSILVGMSINHTRAIFAMDLAGTRLNDSVMPLVDAEDVARHFFPVMFEEATNKYRINKVKKSGKKVIL